MRAFRLREEPWIHALTSTTDSEPPDHEPELNTLETARRCASRSTLSMPTKSARGRNSSKANFHICFVIESGTAERHHLHTALLAA